MFCCLMSRGCTSLRGLADQPVASSAPSCSPRCRSFAECVASGRQRRHRRVQARGTAEHQFQPRAELGNRDVWAAAGMRLQNLLSTVGCGASTPTVSTSFADIDEGVISSHILFAHGVIVTQLSFCEHFRYRCRPDAPVARQTIAACCVHDCRAIHAVLHVMGAARGPRKPPMADGLTTSSQSWALFV